jgi:hypothetical protein
MEPGYATGIPVAFGGTNTPPMPPPPELAGPASANFDYTPFLDVGTDTSPAIGFQGDFHTVHVVSTGAQTGSIGRVQEGVNFVSGSTVLIGPGNYSDNVVITNNIVLDGSGSGSNPAVDTIITAANASLSVILVDNAGGVNAGDRLTVEGSARDRQHGRRWHPRAGHHGAAFVVSLRQRGGGEQPERRRHQPAGTERPERRERHGLRARRQQHGLAPGHDDPPVPPAERHGRLDAE